MTWEAAPLSASIHTANDWDWLREKREKRENSQNFLSTFFPHKK